MTYRHNETRDERRRRWFDANCDAIEFSILIESDEGEVLERPWICPLCFRYFYASAIDVPGVVTYEHAPPKSVQGSEVALTCGDCNSALGDLLDRHAAYEHRARTALDGTSGKPLAVRISDLPATVRVNDEGLEVCFQDEAADAPGMAEFIAAGPPESLEFTVAQSWDEQRTRLSYLKAAYIIVFARWGYHMIMSPAFKPIRRQLREPTTAWLRRPPVMWRTDWPAGLYHARHATLGDMALVGFVGYVVLLPLRPMDRTWCERLEAEAGAPTAELQVASQPMPWPTEPQHLFDYERPVGANPQRVDLWADDDGEA